MTQSRPRIFWRGQDRIRKQRIQTGAAFWDSLLFASSRKEDAKWYGPCTQKIEAKKSAKIVYEGARDFVRLQKGTSKMMFLARAELIAKRAKDAGYDAVWFKRQMDVGTAIVNPRAFYRGKLECPDDDKLRGCALKGKFKKCKR